ncbi:rod shape-determining protein MreC [Nocardiopsis gilva YIM 90087]|uniref:Cell shape-determining protein MreC n=1 Tax=Nocardiopsis gilva YIM 90087 TaxID=1235441 RepID=A0A223S9L4_9ACTN|nr:rod shape-determining protein MreC [Nocardiopsis gilva]ASU84825.1 rod shape-determining protein MreC [Nocardiopsis gilva YIM 90087]
MGRGTSRSRLALLLAIALALIILDSRDGDNPVSAVARAAGDAVFAPVSAGVSVVGGPFKGTYRTLVAAPGAQDRIAELEAENAELSARLDDRERDDRRAQDLERLLGLSGRGRYEIVPAQAVTQVTSRGLASAVTIDVGTRDGVHSDMTVLNGDGLVGRVTRAGKDTSTVLLLTDASSAVGARLEGSQRIGVAEGGSRSIGDSVPLRFELMDADAQVQEGDRIVTLGSHDGAPYVPGVPIGTVTNVRDTPGALSRIADVDPAADVAALDIVGVVVAGPEKDPRDSVLPPEPEERRNAAMRPPEAISSGSSGEA